MCKVRTIDDASPAMLARTFAVDLKIEPTSAPPARRDNDA
jgi:hypothetical protein